VSDTWSNNSPKASESPWRESDANLYSSSVHCTPPNVTAFVAVLCPAGRPGPLGLWTWWAQETMQFRWGFRSPMGRGNFEGEGVARKV